jgi:hypothetical protein
MFGDTELKMFMMKFMDASFWFTRSDRGWVEAREGL